MPNGQTFLPANLRPAPQAPGPTPRRPTRWWLQAITVTAVCICIGILLNGWRLKAVDATGCTGLPASAVVNLEGLRGHWIPMLDLDQVRQDVECWPGVAEVAVELQLPSTLRIRALPDEICASIPMGRTWRGITCNGTLSRSLVEPQLPLLLNFDGSVTELRSALSTGNRLCDGTNGRLLSIRKITPSDYELTISVGADPETPSIVKMAPQGTPSEQWWRTAALNGQAPSWADLRFDHHIVVRRTG